LEKIKSLKTTTTSMVEVIVRSLRLVWPTHRGVLVAFFAISIVTAVVPFLSMGAWSLMVAEVTRSVGKGFSQYLMLLVAATVALSFLGEVVRAVSQYFNKRMWIEVKQTLDILFMTKKTEIDVETYERPAFNDLIEKADEKGTSPLTSLVESQFENANSLVQIALALAVFTVVDWRIGILAACAAIPDFVVEAKFGKSTWSIHDADAQTRRRYSSLRHHFYSVDRLIELRVFQNTAKFLELAKHMLEGFSTKQKDLNKRALGWRITASGISSVLEIAILVWLCVSVLYGSIGIELFIFAFAAVGRFQSSLGGFFATISRQFEWCLYVADFFRVLDTKPIARGVSTALVPDTPPEIVFDDVSFSYPDTDRPILRNINISVPAGGRLALVGQNGAGKSTLIKLLLGFYRPTKGRILIGGIDLRDIDLASLYDKTAALFQDYGEYNFLAGEVISLGRSDVPVVHEHIVAAAKAAGAHDFISEWPNGYQQMIGREFDGGINPSVGQAQRIALARTLYRNPRLLILDEPTAALDAEAEEAVFAELEQKSSERTEIFISHRFSTVRRAQSIYVLEEGQVLESGTHDQLMEKGGRYAHLFSLQAKGYQ